MLVWSFFVFSGQVFAQPHTLLDPSFDGDGKAFTQFLPTNNKGLNAILQPDGKIIVVGSGSAGPTSPQTIQAAVVRYHPDGYLIGAIGGGAGGYFHFWKPDGATEFFQLKLPDTARDCDLHPDGLRLAAAHFDTRLRIYRMGDPAPAA